MFRFLFVVFSHLSYTGVYLKGPPQVLKAASSSFSSGFGFGHNLRSLPTCGRPTFGLSQHVGGRRLCLEVFVWVLGVMFVVVFLGVGVVWFCLGIGFVVWLCLGVWS